MHEFRKAVAALREQGWVPAILQSELEFLRLAGVDQDMPLRSAQKPRGGPHAGSGELFFRGEGLYYCVASGAGDPAFEIGLISKNAADIDKRVRSFASAVEMAVRRSVDGPKVRGKTFEWTKPKPDRSRLAALVDTETQDEGARFATLPHDRELATGVAAAAEPLAREILADLVLAGFSRTRDILAGRRSEAKEARSALDKLRRAGLITLEHLLECRKYGTPLTRLTDPGKLQTAEVAELVCPSCGARFSEENVCEGFSASELGRRLSRNAHWLTVLMMHELFELGVPGDFMVWNTSQPDEGVDVAVEFLGRFWTFELKEGKFGAGDVLGFNRRRERYRPQKAFAVSAERISPDAKRLFEELPSEQMPVCLSGLGKVTEALRREVHAASLGYACGRLQVIEDVTGYDVGRVVAARFEEKAPVRRPRPDPAAEPEATAADMAAGLQQAPQK